MRSGAIFLLLTSTLSLPALDLCRFSALAAEESIARSEGLSASAYLQLLTSPAAAKLDPSALRKMIAEKDPFTVPEESDVDLHSLRRQLTQFKEILEKSQWNTPALRERLLVEAGHLVEALERARSTSKAAVKASAGDMVTPIPSSARVSPIPGRAELLVLTKEPRVLRILNLESNSLRPVDLTDEYFSEASVTLDGRHVIFGRFNGVLNKVPFSGKDLDWKNAKDLGAKVTALKKISVQNFIQLPDRGGMGEKVLATTGGSHPVFLYSLTTNERVDVNYSRLPLTVNDILAWGAAGDGGKIYLLVKTPPANCRLDVVEINENGVLTPVAGESRVIRGNSPQILWSKGRGPLVSYSSVGLWTIPAGQTEQKFAYVAEENEEVTGGAAHDQWAVALVSRTPKSDGQKLMVFDSNSAERIGALELKGESVQSIQFLPDGRLLLKEILSGNVRIMNLDGRL